MSDEHPPWPSASMPPFRTPILIPLTPVNGVQFLANVDHVVEWDTGAMARLNKDGRGRSSCR